MLQVDSQYDDKAVEVGTAGLKIDDLTNRPFCVDYTYSTFCPTVNSEGGFPATDNMQRNLWRKSSIEYFL